VLRLKETAAVPAASASAERAIAGLQTRLETSKATCAADAKKLRHQISALKLKETAAATAASASSKILDSASEEVTRSKSECIRDLREQILEQLKAINNGRTFQGKVDELKAKVAAFIKEKKDWTKEKKDIAKSGKKVERADEGQACPPAENGRNCP
jgi:hypothetical protein